MRKKVMRILSLCMVASMTLTPIQSVYAAEMTSVIKINEVESNVNTKSNTYTTLSYDKKMNKVYLVTTAVGTGKLISKVEQPLSDFVTEE